MDPILTSSLLAFVVGVALILLGALLDPPLILLDRIHDR
jgi:hypothetical protein